MDFSSFPKSKILLITNDYPPQKGGVSWYYHNLVRRMNADLTRTDADDNSLQLPLNLRGRGRCEVLKLRKWAMTPLWPFLIVLIIIKSLIIKPDFWWVGQVLPVGTVVWLLSYVWRKPYIVSTHGMDILVPLKSRRKQWLVKNILEGAVMITANSEWTRRKIVEHYFSNSKLKTQNSKLIVVYPEPKPKRVISAEEVRSLREKLGIPEHGKVLLTVGRLVRRKGIDRVLTALSEVWKKNPDVHYVAVGEGEERGKLEEKSILPLKVRGTQEGVMSDEVHNSPNPSYLKRGNEDHESHIHFVGSVTDDDLAGYYTLADAFILLPRELDGDAEGFGIVYLEANQYGLPIVGCVSGGTGEALQQCQNTLLVSHPDDRQEVAKTICQAFQ